MSSAGLQSDFSRRSLGRRALSLLGAGAALPFYNEPALAQLSMIGPLPADAVKINANENPLGPCPEAAEAIYGVVKKGGRYMYEETFSFAKTLAEQEGLKPNYVMPFPGSSDPLHRAVLAYTSPDKPFVMGDPGYEAGQRAAQFIGSKVIRVPLTKDHAHDVKAMAAASPNAGVIYICNPNNPTGTITKKADIQWLLANKPKGSLLLLDEATSALDPDTERQVSQNLKQAFAGRTVFYITHRLNTIRHADKILMMDKGAVVESGTHEQLMALKGRYYCLYQQQEAGN